MPALLAEISTLVKAIAPSNTRRDAQADERRPNAYLATFAELYRRFRVSSCYLDAFRPVKPGCIVTGSFGPPAVVMSGMAPRTAVLWSRMHATPSARGASRKPNGLKLPDTAPTHGDISAMLVSEERSYHGESKTEAGACSHG
jgi:hypothetical protein